METRNANLYCIIAGAVLLIVGLLAWVGQDQFDGMSLWGWISLGLGALSLAFGLWESRRGLRSGMRRRSTRIGLQVAMMIVLVVGIIVVVVGSSAVLHQDDIRAGDGRPACSSAGA